MKRDYLLLERLDIIERWIFISHLTIARSLGMVGLRNKIANRDVLGLIERSERL